MRSTLQVLTLRTGYQVTTRRVTRAGQVLHLCSRAACPHFAGQLALPGLDTKPGDSYCRLVGYEPAETCSPLYREQAEEIDSARRRVWTMEEAEREERRRG